MGWSTTILMEANGSIVRRRAVARRQSFARFFWVRPASSASRVSSVVVGPLRAYAADMKLGVFNLWTEMRELPKSDAFEVAPLFSDAVDAQKRAQAASTLRAGRPTVERTTATKKRKPVVIVDEITAS